jgi:hypothetical protein
MTVMTYGESRLALERVPNEPGKVQFHLYNSGTPDTWPSPITWKVPITPAEIHHELQIVVTVDPNLHRFVVAWYNDEIMLNHYVAGDGPATVQQTPSRSDSAPAVVTLRDIPLRQSTVYATDQADRSQNALCWNLTQKH